MLELHPMRYEFPWVHTLTRNFIDPPTLTSAGNSVASWSNMRTGVDLPQWRDLIKQMGDATTVFSGTSQYAFREAGEILLNEHYSSAPSEKLAHACSGLVYNPSFPSSLPSVMDSTTNEALSRVYKKIHEAQSQLAGLVVLGELRETLEMLRHPAKSLRALAGQHIDKMGKYLKSVRNGRDPSYFNKADLKKIRKTAADSWLEWSFGVKPLVSDIRDALKALERIGESRQHVDCIGMSLQEATTMGSPSLQWAGFYGDLPFYQTLNQSSKVKVRYKVGVKIEVLTPIEQIQHLFGLTPWDVVPAIWELIPWSFLVDYFVNIGDVLQSVFTSTTGVYRVTKTVWREAENAYATEAAWDQRFSPGTTVDSKSHKAEHVWMQLKSVDRTKGVLQIPDVQFHLPSQTEKWINIAALVASKKLLNFNRINFAH